MGSWRRRVLAAGALLWWGLAGCTGGGWVEDAKVAGELVEPPEVEAPGCPLPGPGQEPLGPDEPEPAPAPEPEPGTGNDPYTGAGARQLPGPFMTHQPPPAGPEQAVVVRPLDPDEHVAARNPDGEVTGPVPEPKQIPTSPPPPGAGQPAPEPTPRATPDPAGPPAAQACAPGGSL